MDQDRNTVLEIDRAWYVQPHWYVDGTAAYYLGGTWNIVVKVESMGEEQEGVLVRTSIPTTYPGTRTINHRLEYRPWIRIPSRLEDPDRAIRTDGEYKLIVALTIPPHSTSMADCRLHRGTHAAVLPF